MKIKNFNAEKEKYFSGKSRAHLFWKMFSIILGFLIILAITPVAYFVYHHPNSKSIIQTLDRELRISETLSSYSEVAPYRLKSILAVQDTINIDMKHINVQKIEYMRKRAIEGEKDFEYVPAIIRFGDKSINVKIRLKGDRIIHYDDEDTASYRVKIEDDNTLFGMKKFSIHKPRARNHLYEWVYLRMMEQAGIMAPQYKYAHVNFNGKDIGLYVIEEHYDKYLIERHRNREGPIIRFKEENVNKNYKFISKYYETPIVPYEGKKWEKPENLPVTKKAVYLLEGFRRGEFKASQVFDIEKLAMFFALTDLTGTHHGSAPKSLRFYYNPITAKLEPIPFDGHFGTLQQPMITSEIGISPNTWLYIYWKEFFVSFFNDPNRPDPEFIQAYISALRKVSSVSYLDDFFNKTKHEFEQAFLATYSELPLEDNISSYGPVAFKFDKDIYYERRKYIEGKLSKPTIIAHIAEQTEKQIVVEVNRLDRQFPSEIISLICDKKVLNPTPETSYLVGTLPLNETEIHKVSFILEENQADSFQSNTCNELNYRILGSYDVYKSEVYSWPSYDHNFINNDVARSVPNHKEFSFIQNDEAKKILNISRGTHTVSRNIILPPAYKVVAGPGTTLILTDGALIYSRSPLNFTGTKEEPVIITSSDGTGQGLAVIGAQGQSYLKHVKFSNLRNPNQQGWSIMGAITFYESPVTLASVTVQENNSEDAINIVRSHFNIEDLKITGSSSDALDIDFSEGRIIESRFENLINDGIDISGTKIELHNVEIINSGDKGISAGEESDVTARNVRMFGTILGVASKDKSIVRITDLEIKNSTIAIAAYQKKSEFGSGAIYVENFNFDGQGIKSLIEKGSLLVIDKDEYPGQEIDVAQWILNVSEARSERL